MTGLALLIVPVMVGGLLFGAELTDVAVVAARVAGIALVGLGIACWPGMQLIGMLTYSAGVALVSRLGRPGWRFNRHPAVAGGRPARDPDGTADQGIEGRPGSESLRGNARVDRVR